MIPPGISAVLVWGCWVKSGWEGCWLVLTTLNGVEVGYQRSSKVTALAKINFAIFSCGFKLSHPQPQWLSGCVNPLISIRGRVPFLSIEPHIIFGFSTSKPTDMFNLLRRQPTWRQKSSQDIVPAWRRKSFREFIMLTQRLIIGINDRLHLLPVFALPFITRRPLLKSQPYSIPYFQSR